MRKRIHLGGILLVAILASFLAGRFATIASNGETGWETVRLQWEKALPKWLNVERTPVPALDPSEQADYWLAETARILKANPDSAELHMGAAWVLHVPGDEYISRLLSEDGIESENESAWEDTDESFYEDFYRTSRAVMTFERKCHQECLDLAKRATELDSHDLRSWRLRALLQFQPYVFAADSGTARSETWIEELDECANHDPENALYDYLIALRLWDNSAKHEFHYPDDLPDGEYRLEINDQRMFERAIEYFEAGQEKSFVAIGEAGYPAIAHFLSLSNVTKLEQQEIALSRQLNGPSYWLTNALFRWLSARADRARQVGEYHQQKDLVLQELKLLQQSITPKEYEAFHTLRRFGQWNVLDPISKLSQEKPELVSQVELAELLERQNAIQFDARIADEAALQIAKASGDPTAITPQHFVVSDAPNSALLLLSSSVLFFFAATIATRRGSTPAFGVWRHFIAWVLGCGFSFIVFGLAPAEIISRDAQRWAIKAVICAAVLSAAATILWFTYRVLRHRRFQFSLSGLLGLVFVVGLFCSLLPTMQLLIEKVEAYPPEVLFPTRGQTDSEFGAELLLAELGLAPKAWGWAMVQWLIGDGLQVGSLVSLLLIVVWYAWRSARLAGEGTAKYWRTDIRNRWGQLGKCLGKSMLVAGMGCLMAYFWFAPDTIRSNERHFQDQMGYCRDPIGELYELEAIASRIRERELKALRQMAGTDG